jgi:hypothetical protein
MSVIINGDTGITTPAETVQGALTTTGNTILGDATTDTLNVGNGGLVKDASSNVGIGTASPAYKLDINGSVHTNSGYALTTDGSYFTPSGLAAIPNYGLGSPATSQVSLSAFSAIPFYTNQTERMRIDSSGNVGIGTASPSAKLQLDTTSDTIFRMNTGGTNIGYLEAYTGGATPLFAMYSVPSNGNMAFGTNNTERMRIDSSGNLLVNTTSALGGKISVVFDGSASNGVRCKTTYATNGSQFVDFLNSGGSQIGYISQNGASSVNYSTSSDYRLKNTIAPMTDALDKVALLKPVTYKWNADGSDGQGFIAHELAEVVPDCVTGEKDAVNEDGSIKSQGIDTSFLVATLTAAIQELKAIVDAQAVRIAALES